CRRPIKVCWCPYLPNEPIAIETNLYILQHPYEETRCLRTAPMLVRSLPSHKCHLIQGKKYPRSKFPDLEGVINAPNTLLLFPGPDAVNIENISNDLSTQYNLIVIDGTWQQAKGIYHQNPVLHIPKKVQVHFTGRSKYSIRTQPNDHSLSTLESVALALSTLEEKPEIADILTRPLEALVKFQLDHGAKAQESRDYKIKNGLWTKRLPKSVLKKREKEEREHKGKCD
ncbi:hypothetical protein LOTGIDRAFT_118026, partial [Lottia gigantea]